MRYAVASDIHGSAVWCRRMLDDASARGADKLILLGDLMYHGPRNPLPEGYDPAEVTRMLNGWSERIVAVRGNCDSEVDQMLLEFPCMGDYVIVMDDGVQMLCTHGHLDICGLDFRESLSNGGRIQTDRPMLSDGSIVFSGHTHVKIDETPSTMEGSTPVRGLRHINPGSVGLPKDGTHSYAVYEDGVVEFIELK